MDMTKLIGTAVVVCVLNLLIKEYKREYSPLISICCAGGIFAFIIPKINEVIERISAIAQRMGVEGEYIMLAMKIVGISYITALCCELCRDAGENALALNMEFAGKIILTAISLPVIGELFMIVERILP